ncbi:MAG: hypothetical protein CSB49_06685 [Proteobacteria bacterium]|nr:MAG: hypothetical protein CSB49_06685 [Pseudomonadota bacterium]
MIRPRLIRPRRRRLAPGLLLAAVALAMLLAPRPALAAGLAVFRVDPLGVDAGIVARLDGLLRIELARLADAAMPGPAAVQTLMRKHKALAGCTGDVTCLAEAGRLLGVDRIISGNVGGLGDSYVVNLKIVDVKSKKELRKIQETISGRPDQLIEAVRVAAYGLVAPDKLRGALAVLANVPKAQVRLDGELLGTTPLPVKRGLKVGAHTLRVSKAGYLDVVQEVKVRFQKTAEVVVKLELPKVAGGKLAPRKVERPVPWYTSWWFWSLVGVAAVGAGVGLGYALSGSPAINCSAEPEQCGL